MTDLGLSFELPYDFGWGAYGYAVGRDVVGDHTSGTYDSTLTDGHTRHYNGADTDVCSVFNYYPSLFEGAVHSIHARTVIGQVALVT